jgi:hypothetical protein
MHAQLLDQNLCELHFRNKVQYSADITIECSSVFLKALSLDTVAMHLVPQEKMHKHCISGVGAWKNYRLVMSLKIRYIPTGSVRKQIIKDLIVGCHYFHHCGTEKIK